MNKTFKRYLILVLGLLFGSTIFIFTINELYNIFYYSKYEDLVFLEAWYNCKNCNYVGVIESILQILLSYFIIVMSVDLKKAPYYEKMLILKDAMLKNEDSKSD